VNRAALSGAIDTLRPIADTLRTRCDGVDGFEIPRICDCEPWATPTCEDNRCGYDVGRSCLGLCDPVAQTGCWAAEKCSWIWIVRETDVGIVACVADGTVPAGVHRRPLRDLVLDIARHLHAARDLRRAARPLPKPPGRRGLRTSDVNRSIGLAAIERKVATRAVRATTAQRSRSSRS
jgi:hypothetical protein